MALPQVMVGAPVSAGGAFAAAPVGSTLPTDATTPLDGKFTVRGLIGEDGFTLAQDRNTTEVKAWGGSTARKLTSEYSETIKVTFLESSNADVLKALFGESNVSVSGKSVKVSHTAEGGKEMAWAVTMKDGENVRRLVAPRGQVFLSGEVQYVHNDVIKYNAEITCYPDENGATTIEYIDMKDHEGDSL